MIPDYDEPSSGPPGELGAGSEFALDGVGIKAKPQITLLGQRVSQNGLFGGVAAAVLLIVIVVAASSGGGDAPRATIPTAAAVPAAAGAPMPAPSSNTSGGTPAATPGPPAPAAGGGGGTTPAPPPSLHPTGPPSPPAGDWTGGGGCQAAAPVARPTLEAAATYRPAGASASWGERGSIEALNHDFQTIELTGAFYTSPVVFASVPTTVGGHEVRHCLSLTLHYGLPSTFHCLFTASRWWCASPGCATRPVAATDGVSMFGCKSRSASISATLIPVRRRLLLVLAACACACCCCCCCAAA